jgi:hypothetical protein
VMRPVAELQNAYTVNYFYRHLGTSNDAPPLV